MIVVVAVGRRLPFFSRLIDLLLERGLTVVVIGDAAARNAVIGRNVTCWPRNVGFVAKSGAGSGSLTDVRDTPTSCRTPADLT